ncbi:MAG: hypothetical protein JXA06_14205 [Bacteroidetes bacterium]|nr:hypothetical protein [Bacteroidota bacterium]
MTRIKKLSTVLFIVLITSTFCQAQFLDNFDKNKIDGWFFFTGDGAAEMDFVQNNGYATIVVDAAKDKYNVYWALIKRDVTKYLDLNKLKDTTYQLRVEAKVRVHNAPRRLNFMVNTNRTTNYHIDLMEFDIPDTTDWHVISMTTKKFDALPGDTVYVQLAATDFGIGKYYVDIDYYRADIVNVKLAGPDKGELVPYHPPVPEISTFSNHLAAAHDCVINSDFSCVNFNNWSVKEQNNESRILTINANQWAVLRWDLEKFKNMKINGAGLLELTTQSVSKGGNYTEVYGEDFGMEFGKIRIIEILGGDPAWDQNKVTYDNLIQGHEYSEVFNTQMIFDSEVIEEHGGKNYITISRPVMQRLIDGRTKGLLIRPLGAIDASFYSLEDKSGNGPKLHFNIKK